MPYRDTACGIPKDPAISQTASAILHPVTDEDGRYLIFTLIQKFNKPSAEPIYPDHDIIIMSDEAHRSQYGIFADHMMKLLPTAARIGFTGTPLKMRILM